MISACLGNTPITFPIEWASSKIPGYAIRASVPNFHGFTAFVVMSSVAARFFTPQVTGIGAAPASGRNAYSASITTKTSIRPLTCNTSPGRAGRGSASTGATIAAWWPGPAPWAAAQRTERHRFVVDASDLTPDQQFQAGLFCGGVLCHADHSHQPRQHCARRRSMDRSACRSPRRAPRMTITIRRASPRAVCSISASATTTFSTVTRYKWSARLTVVNLTNKEALYNFLSTFSGTHYVTPRAVTGDDRIPFLARGATVSSSPCPPQAGKAGCLGGRHLGRFILLDQSRHATL